ncbi:MAG: RluA family pseudouridine synthase [Treponemataceae bacterium]|nr:RluA family pseudouridine synthase [Treponemataceae bacterium]
MKKFIPYTTIYSDDDIVVFNKASGLLVAGDRYDKDAPRLDLLAEKEFGSLMAVHRIDKDTSGLIVYARNPEAHKNLSMQFENREVKKTYHAIVYGRPAWKEHKVDLPLLADGDDRHRTVINKRYGKKAETEFRLIGTCGQFSWIEAKPLTGRTHQIRVHLGESQLSIVCDPLYGGNTKPIRLSEIKRNWKGDVFEERPLMNRLALHAYEISFTHPSSGEIVTFNAPYSKDMESVRYQFEKLFGVNPLNKGEVN